MADTHLTDPENGQRSRPLEGLIKTVVLSDKLAVSFAGSLYWAEKALAEVDDARKGAVDVQVLVDILSRVHEMSGRKTDFLIAEAGNTPGLIEVKNGRAHSVVASWLGSWHGFERFQGFATGALLPKRQPTNTVAFEVFKVPEASPGEVCESYSGLVNAMRSVIDDETIPEVGGFVVPVGIHDGRFAYMHYATVLTNPIAFDKMPPEFVVHFGTVEEGGYGFNLIADRTSGAKGMAVYALQGKYGVAFTPQRGLLRPTPFTDVSPLEFEEAVASELSLDIACMFTQPEEHCSRALALADAGNIVGALDEADRAIARSAKLPAGHRCRGVLLARQGRLADALDAFTSALSLAPEHAPTLDNRGLVLARMGRLREACLDFGTAQEADAKYERAQRHLSMAAEELRLSKPAEGV
jgi:Tetratricopeptide repeat